MERETRALLLPCEARKGDAGGPTTLVGYASTYGRETVIAGLFREVVEPGAFNLALSRPDDVRALFNHDPNWLLGRTKSGTLRLSSDGEGLRYEVDINADDPNAQSVMARVERGDIDGSSFSFVVDAEEWEYPKEGLPLRRIKDVTLYDIAPVVYPAYGSTSVSARAEARAKQAPADTQAATANARKRWAQAHVSTRV